MKMKTNAFDFEGLFELSPDLLCISGYDGYFKKINSSVVKTLGYSFEELYSRRINDFIHPSDLRKTDGWREGLTKDHSIVNFENRYLTKSGEIIWLSWTAKAAEEGEIIFAVAKNITDKKREENDRTSHLADLSQRNKNYQQLTFTTAHDLRPPIDNILAIIQLLDPTDLGEENGQLMDILGMATAQLKTKLSTYIDNLSKNHLVKVEIESIDFKSCLSGVTFSIRHLIETSKASIRTDFTEIENVLFSRKYLESIFLNLLSNAIKYARPTVRPEIAIYSKLENGQVKLYLEDNGMGFDLEEVKDKIFGLHQTFHKNPDSKGIGLYLVYTHITSLGGTIAVESEVNKGTRFIISFNDGLVENI